MKILLVNTYDRGGAANACLRLHQGLLSEGMESKVLLRSKENSITNTYKFEPLKRKITITQKINNKLKSALKKLKLIPDIPFKANNFLKIRSPQLELFSYPYSNYDITESNLYKEADIINLHWVADFLDYESFFSKNTKPVIWTLHDMNPFAGGEHYEEQFLGINNLGEPIPRIMTSKEKKISNGILNFKLELFKNVKNLIIVAPSKWLVSEAKKSLAFKGKQVFHIPYGLNKGLFTPRDKNASREILKIPKNKKVILFVAESINNNRKGFMYLKKAVEQLTMDNVVLCAIGKKKGSLDSIDNVIELGNINDDNVMCMVYSAADVFVIPSLMDNLPNTVLESFMCGTPVIGFPVGGISDMIEDGVNGLLTKDISVAALLNTLKYFLTHELVFDRNSIRAGAVKKYSLEVQAQMYVELFNNTFKNNK